jgi:hypothetical protein
MRIIERSLEGEHGGTSLDARRMSISTSACYDFAAYPPRSSARKIIPQHFLGSAAVACLVLGCAWTVYSNVLGASVYPTLSSANYDLPVVKHSPMLAAREPLPATRNVMAALPESGPVIAAPATTVASGPTPSFADRFAAAAPQGVESNAQIDAPKLAEASKPKEIPLQPAPVKMAAAAPVPPPAPARMAAATRGSSPAPVKTAAVTPASPPASVQMAAVTPEPAPHPAESRKSPVAAVRDMAQRAKAAVMSIASAEKSSIVEKLWGKPQARGSLLAYASADVSSTSSLGPTQNPALGGSQPRYDQSTAVYDISAHMVYLPDGSKLEAHSGLGSKLDDPGSANIRMRGVTPPHLYELTPREALFHGVPALRLNPVGGEETIYGRSGLLAHTFMLGPNGDSNGCVSFRDYNAFLNAYRNQGIKRLAVVARID